MPQGQFPINQMQEKGQVSVEYYHFLFIKKKIIEVLKTVCLVKSLSERFRSKYSKIK